MNDDSGVKYIVNPMGNKIYNTNTTTYTVNSNGIYIFVVCDLAGNLKPVKVEIKNIDDRNYNVTITKDNDKDWINKDVSVTIDAKEN